MGAYSNKYGTSKTPLSISFNIQTRAPGSRSLKIGYALFFNPLLSFWISDETMPVVFDILVFKLINYTWSWSQKPINENHLGQVDESWYQPIFIWGETCFSSQIKDLHFNSVLLINTTHGNNENTSENISLHNFLLFHLKRHHGLALSSVSRCLEPMMKHSPSFFTYYTKISIVS